MKKNMKLAMDRLDIDEGIRDLLGMLWKHNYQTIYSCEGHLKRSPIDHKQHIPGYISFLEGSGDGWFETQAPRYGFSRVEKDVCCALEEDEFVFYYMIGSKLLGQKKTKEFLGRNYCGECGAGINGVVNYTRIRDVDL